MDAIFKVKLMNFFGHLLSILLIGYIVFLLSRVIWYNWNLNEQEKLVKIEIQKTELEQKNLENLIVYYQSQSFKDIEARQKLGLKKPDEKAVSVPQKKYENFEKELQVEKQSMFVEKVVDKMPNWKLWWEYFTRK